MGCDIYYVSGRARAIQFNEIDDETPCLCTFSAGDELPPDRDTVRSLAYLGAAVVLESHGELESGVLPDGLPEWIRHGIDSALFYDTVSQNSTDKE